MFSSAIFSTVSSGVNSLAAVTLEDFIKPWLEHKSSTNYSQSVYYVITIVIGEDVESCFMLSRVSC